MTLRLFWFLLGAGSATFFIKKHQKLHEGSSNSTNWGCPYDAKKSEAQQRQGGPNVTLTEYQRWGGWGNGWHHRTLLDWEEDRAKMLAFSRQATDTVGEMSEAALDTLLSTATALKSRLAEARAQREQEVNNERQSQSSRWTKA